MGDYWHDAQQDIDRHEDDCECDFCLEEDEKWKSLDGKEHIEMLLEWEIKG